MNKLKVEYGGITHYYASCSGCDWSEEDHTNPVGVRVMVRKHVQETGHMVTIEKGVVSHYTLEKECE